MAHLETRTGPMVVNFGEQALEALPGGPWETLEARRLAEGPKSPWEGFDYQFIARKIAPTCKIPAGEHYVRVESGRGELSIF